MGNHLDTPAGRYGLAVASVGLAVALRAVLYQTLGGGMPFIAFLPAVIITALYAGLGPALLAVALSALAATFWFAPVGSPTVAQRVDLVSLALFVVVSLCIVWLNERHRRADRRATSGVEAQARLAAVVQSSDDAIVSKDLQGTIQSWNAAAERLFGYTADEVIGKSIKVLIPPDRQPEEDLILAQLRRGGQVDHYETVRLRKDGTPIEVSVTVSPVRDASGRVIGASKIARSTTEQRRAEARNRFLVNLHDAVRPLTDPEEITKVAAKLLGEFLRVDRCAYADVEEDQDTFNLTGDYTARGVPSIVGRYRLADFGAEVLRLHREGKPFVSSDVETDPAAAPERAAYHQTQIRAVISVPMRKAGKFVAGMAVHQRTPRQWRPDEVELVQAVADRIWESIERARIMRELRDSEARFRAVVETTPECVKIVAPDGTLLYMNCAGLGMIEADAEQAIGGCVFDVIAPEHREKWIERHQCVCAGERLTWEFQIQGLKGTRRWLETHAVPLQLPDSRVAQLAVTRDTTERKKIETERERLLEAERDARAEAERASRMKDEFLANLSHELRTPLNAILGWSQILSGNGKASEQDIREGLATIERNARVQTQIIEDLLDMSRIISGKVRLDVQRVELSPIVQAAIETIRPAAEAKQIRLHTVLDPLAGSVSGDPNRLQQVFWNLLSNAVKFTPRGGRVQVLLARVNSHLEVSVSDTGEGIAPQFLPHVFDRFRQADASTTRQHGGLGLGLAIAKQLVELHGGSISAKSPGAGQGATFTVALPPSVIRSESVDAPERRHPTGGPAAPLPAEVCADVAGLKVLVVDDESDARALLKRLLEDCQVQVSTASSAAEALQRLSEDRPDVLLSDIGMPGEDGYSLIRRVRGLGPEQGGNTPAVALTAYARSEDRTRSVLAGFQMHIAKPVEPAELIAIIASLAGKTAPRQG